MTLHSCIGIIRITNWFNRTERESLFEKAPFLNSLMVLVYP